MLKECSHLFEQKLPIPESLFYFCVVDKLIPHIEKLLACNDHAVVPGLGGFVVQKRQAVISNGKIFPPSATISFNPLIHHTDGMLAVAISKEMRISYREAAKLIEDETGRFLIKLRKSRKLGFGNIGTFHADKEAHLLFLPAENVDFLPNNFGLKPISLPVSNINKSKDIVFTLPARQLMKYAAIFITFICLLFSTEVNDNAKVIKADFYSLNKVELPEVTVTPAPATPNEEVSTTASTAEAQYTYKVVVAAFQSEKTALEYRDQLIAGNFDESEVITASSNSKVVIRTFPDLISAVNYMEQIRRQDARFADAWVMKSEKLRVES